MIDHDADVLIDHEIDATTVRIYQLRVTHPTDHAAELAERAGLTAEEVVRA